MRGALFAVLVWSTTAHAETAEELRIHGEALAKAGRYSEAIDAFKTAEAKEHRVRHACLIGLAYERRQAWSQAELFLGDCKANASSADPLPEWAPEAFRVLADGLAEAGLVAVTFASTPGGATLALSAFAPDEQFTPRTLHLPPGAYTVRATAKGYRESAQSFTVKDPQTVTIALDREPVVAAPAPAPSKVPWIVIGAGAAVAVAGGVIHATAYRTARNTLAGDSTQAQYDKDEAAYDRDRELVVGAYALGGAAIVTGVILHFAFTEDGGGPEVAVSPTRGGGMLTFGWSR